MAKAMGVMSSEPHFDPNLFVISLFVQEVKRKLDFVGQNELNCRLKFGLVTTAQDWMQAPHLDCEVTPGNYSWILRVSLCTLGSYMYIWGDDDKKKILYGFLWIVSWCCTMICEMVVFVEAREIFGCMVVFLIVLLLTTQPS